MTLKGKGRVVLVASENAARATDLYLSLSFIKRTGKLSLPLRESGNVKGKLGRDVEAQ